MTPDAGFVSHLHATTLKRVAEATLVVAALLFVAYVVLRLYRVLFILFVGIVISVAIRSPVNWLCRRGLPRPLCIILVYLALLVTVAGFGLLVAPLCIDEGTRFIAGAPALYDDLLLRFRSTPNTLVMRLAAYLPADISAALPAGVPTTPGTYGSVNAATAYLAMVLRALFTGAAILALAFYWSLDGERLLRDILLRLQPSTRVRTEAMIDAMEHKVIAYLRGVFILSVTMALMAGGAYFAVGLPYVVGLAVITGVLEMLPIVGPTLAAVPPVVVALTLGVDKAIFTLVAVVAIQQIESSFLVPRVMDRTVGVNAIVSILSIGAFAALFGLGGAIMAIPMAAILQVLIDRIVEAHDPPGIQEPASRGIVGVMRVQTNDLIQDVRKQLRGPKSASCEAGDQLEEMVESIATDVAGILAMLDRPGARP